MPKFNSKDREYEEHGNRSVFDAKECIDINFGKLSEVRSANPTDHRLETLQRFAVAIYMRRTDGAPKPEEDIGFRDSDATAIGAILGLEPHLTFLAAHRHVEALGITSSIYPALSE